MPSGPTSPNARSGTRARPRALAVERALGGEQEIGGGEDADGRVLFANDHDAADVVVDEERGGMRGQGVATDGDHGRVHHVADPPVPAVGLRQIVSRHDANERSGRIEDGDVVALACEHGEGGDAERVVVAHDGDGARHEITNANRRLHAAIGLHATFQRDRALRMPGTRRAPRMPCVDRMQRRAREG